MITAHSSYTFAVRILHPKAATLPGEGLLLELETRVLSSSSEDVQSIPLQRVDGLSTILRGEAYISQGARFAQLLTDVIQVCSQCKLLLLTARLLKTASTSIPFFHNVMK